MAYKVYVALVGYYAENPDLERLFAKLPNYTLRYLETESAYKNLHTIGYASSTMTQVKREEPIYTLVLDQRVSTDINASELNGLIGTMIKSGNFDVVYLGNWLNRAQSNNSGGQSDNNQNNTENNIKKVKVDISEEENCLLNALYSPSGLSKVLEVMEQERDNPTKRNVSRAVLQAIHSEEIRALNVAPVVFEIGSGAPRESTEDLVIQDHRSKSDRSGSGRHRQVVERQSSDDNRQIMERGRHTSDRNGQNSGRDRESSGMDRQDSTRNRKDSGRNGQSFNEPELDARTQEIVENVKKLELGPEEQEIIEEFISEAKRISSRSTKGNQSSKTQSSLGRNRDKERDSSKQEDSEDLIVEEIVRSSRTRSRLQSARSRSSSRSEEDDRNDDSRSKRDIYAEDNSGNAAAIVGIVAVVLVIVVALVILSRKNK